MRRSCLEGCFEDVLGDLSTIMAWDDELKRLLEVGEDVEDCIVVGLIHDDYFFVATNGTIGVFNGAAY